MIIKDVYCRLTSSPVPVEKRYRTDLGWMSKYDNTYVIIETDTGINGYGATYGTPEIIKAIVETQLKYILLGEDPTFIERLWQKMYCGARGDNSINDGFSMPDYLRHGQTMAAISAVDIALWDILGKSLGMPVYKLLGACRKSVKAYASGGWETADKIGAETKAYVDKGFAAIKIRAEGKEGKFSIAKSVARVAAVREAVGPDVEIFVDAHGCLDFATAEKYARALEKYNVGWLEEPITPEDYDGISRLREKTTTPIATGEREILRFGFLRLAQTGADVLQPDLSLAGGITEGRRIAAIASAYHKRIATHNWGNPILVAASLHFALSQPNYYLFEVGQSSSPLMTQALTEPFDIRGGYVYPNDKPGFGVEIREDYFERFPFVPGPDFIS